MKLSLDTIKQIERRRHLFVFGRNAKVQSAVHELVFPSHYVGPLGPERHDGSNSVVREGTTAAVAVERQRSAVVRRLPVHAVIFEIRRGAGGGVQVERTVVDGGILHQRGVATNTKQIPRVRLLGDRVPQTLQPSHHVRFHV